MKIRVGLVSNSSSSSFTCDKCLYTVGGWDMGLDEAYMYECVNGHTFCDSHTLGEMDKPEDRYDVPAEMCPICHFETLPDREIVAYFLKMGNLKRTDVIEEIKKEYGDYTNFRGVIGANTEWIYK